MVLIVSSISYYYTNTYNLGNRRKGLLIRFLSPIPLNWTRVEVQITAITPDGEERLFLGFLNKSEIFLDSTKGKFKSVVDKWFNAFGNESIKDFETCLIIDLWIFLKNDTVLATKPCLTIQYSPYYARTGLIIKELGLNLKRMVRMLNPKKLVVRDTVHWIYTYYTWEIIPEYSYEYSGKIPILIIDNSYPNSAELYWNIEISAEYTTECKLTVGYSSTEFLGTDIEFYRGSATYSKKIFFAQDCPASHHISGETWYVYIYATACSYYEKEYKVTEREPDGLIISKEPTGRYRVRQYINNIQIDNYGNVVGGKTNNDDEFSDVVNWLYSSSKEDKVEIAGTSLSDGKLDYDESIYFAKIFDNDVYDVDWEIGLPIGAIFAGIAIACGAPLEFAEALAGFYVSFSYGMSAFLYFGGHIKNMGDVAGYGNKVPLVVYIRLSKAYYNVDGYTFNVPAGVMFRLEPYSSSPSPPPPATPTPYNLP